MSKPFTKARRRQLAPTPAHDISAALLEGLTARSIPALREARDKTTRGSDHGHYRWNLAVGACNGAG
jgi:hypothetical protein